MPRRRQSHPEAIGRTRATLRSKGTQGEPPIHIKVIWPGEPLGPRCEICQRKLTLAPTGRRRKYCSDACRQKRHRRRQRILHSDTFAIARNNRRADKLLRPIERRHGRLDETPQFGAYSVRDFVRLRLANNLHNDFCRHCDKPFINRSNTGLGFIYCSQECKREDRRRWSYIINVSYIKQSDRLIFWEDFDIYRNTRMLEICAHCYAVFARRLTGRPPKYCSRKCRQNAYLQRKRGRIIGYRLCDWCASVYPAHTRWQRFCSSTCKHAWQWKTHAPPSKTVRRETCVICDSALPPQPRPRGGFRQYCSPQCKGKAKRLARKQREMDRFVTHILGGYVTPRGNETAEIDDFPLSSPIFTPNFSPPREEELIRAK